MESTEEKIVKIAEQLFTQHKAEEVEDILFETFEDANIPNLPEETIANRANVHGAIRKILRLVSRNYPSLSSNV